MEGVLIEVGKLLLSLQFKTLKHPQDLPPLSFQDAPSVLPEDPVWVINDPAIALGLLEVGLRSHFQLIVVFCSAIVLEAGLLA